ncbi:hypothetical protein M569_17486 [Genlisea aurea]|uniref:Uncharacterized protein n=1 Tax=Genlisea aurea TaxID=192259 RepID=S8DDF6_9LAMI|nr:hypothetical protein M569_17486 [Genlisea aurea]
MSDEEPEMGPASVVEEQPGAADGVKLWIENTHAVFFLFLSEAAQEPKRRRGLGAGGEKARYCTMSPSTRDYPALALQQFQSEFMEYLRSQKRDIADPEDLAQWWNAHPPSLFRDRVLFLLSSPVSSAAVERLFSMCGQLDANQWALSQNKRRFEFMLQFNGDSIEGRFL